MGFPVQRDRRATYADLEAVPPNSVAELIRGTLHVMPRPAPRHALASSRLGRRLGPFDDDPNGPGGWWILDEPELHFPDPTEPGAVNALVPDIAGWRRERMPNLPQTAYFEIAPDWVCEVLSKSTEDMDRDEKMPVYARENVAQAWLVDPLARTLEVFTLALDRRWTKPAIFRDAEIVRVAPFEALALDLAALWE